MTTLLRTVIIVVTIVIMPIFPVFGFAIARGHPKLLSVPLTLDVFLPLLFFLFVVFVFFGILV